MPSANPPSTASSLPKPISISLGSKSSSSNPTNTTSKSKSKAGAFSNAPKRPATHTTRRAGHFDSDNDEIDDGGGATAQAVTSFDHAAGGAIIIDEDGKGGDGGGEKELRVISTAEGSVNWREQILQRKRMRSGLPKYGAGQNGVVEEGKDRKKGLEGYGLIHSVQKGNNKENEVGDEQPAITKPTDPKPSTTTTPPPHAEGTADSEALSALLGTHPSSTSQLIIHPSSPSTKPPNNPPLPTNEEDEDSHPQPLDEDAFFRADVSSRPDPASLADYVATPVDVFGAALLRGMKRKEGEGHRSKSGGEQKRSTNEVNGKTKTDTNKPPERRPALLGLGAKAQPEGLAAEEVGAWGKNASGNPVGGTGRGGGRLGGATRGKRGGGSSSAAAMGYTPVVRRHKITGEILTEEELRAKVEGSGQLVTAPQNGNRDDWRRRKERDSRGDEGYVRRSDYYHSREGEREPARERERRRDPDRNREKDGSDHRRERDRRHHRGYEHDSEVEGVRRRNGNSRERDRDRARRRERYTDHY